MSIIKIIINVQSNNNNQAPPTPVPLPTGSRKHTGLFDWCCGTALAYFSDPYMTSVRAWGIDLLVKWGEKPELAPATAVLVSSAALCAAPAVFRWVVRRFFS